MQILIVRLSSIGDIIQTFRAFYQIRFCYPEAKIAWAVENCFKGTVEALRGLDEVIALPFKEVKKGIYRPIWDGLKKLRKRSFDIVFDFQGNLKSSIVLASVSGKIKVGFDRNCVAEWPNLFFTNQKVSVPYTLPTDEKNLCIVDRVTQGKRAAFLPVRFYLTKEERESVEVFLDTIPKNLLMFCPFSAWDQKTLSIQGWIKWLELVRNDWAFHIVLPYFSAKEEKEADEIRKAFRHVHPWKIPSMAAWQHLMRSVKMVVAVDSASLHLAGVTDIATFSLFGPTLETVYRPSGEKHKSFQGSCPLGVIFERKCKRLRTCVAPCLKEIDIKALHRSFTNHILDVLGKREEEFPPFFRDKNIEPILI